MSDIDFSKIYSFSKLSLFEKCPQQYYFSYLDPVISPIKKQFIKPRDYKTKGQAVHNAITLFYYLPLKERTFKNLKRCLSEAWFSEKDSDKKPPLGKLGGFKNLEEEKKAYLESLHLLKNFFEMESHNPSLFFIPTSKIRDSFEDYESMIKPLDKNFSISGKFDRIDKLEDGSLRIIDFKTGNPPVAFQENSFSKRDAQEVEESKENQDYFQLEFYKLLAELNFKPKVKKVAFFYLADKKVEEIDVSKVNNDKLKKKVLDKIKKIRETKEFNPNPNKLCYHCDFKEICPAHNKRS